MLSMREFGELIATKRKEFGYTQETFAGKLGITPQAVSKWENGVGYPDISLFPAIADVFDMSIDELFGRETKTAETPFKNEEVLQGEVVEEAEIPHETKKEEKKSKGGFFRHFNIGGATFSFKSDDENENVGNYKDFNISDFKSIYGKLCNACKVRIIKSDKIKLDASGTKRFMESLNIEVINETLNITMKNYNAVNENNNRIDIYVNFDRGEMLDLNLSGAVDLDIDPDFDVASFVTSGACDVNACNFGQVVSRLSGACDFTMGNANDADFIASGACDITIGDVDNSFKTVISGAGDIKANSLHNAHIQMSGSGDATINNASGELTVKISGSSDANINGQVDKLYISVSGSCDFCGTNLTANEADIIASGPCDIKIDRIIGSSREKIDRWSDLKVNRRG